MNNVEDWGNFETDMLSVTELRDYFASMALPAVYRDYITSLRHDGDSEIDIGEPIRFGVTSEGIARECYALADAMLYVRKMHEN